MFKKSLIVALIILILLSMPTLASTASNKHAKSRQVISSVSDPVGDVSINPCGYIDMIQANVRMYLPNPVIESGMLIFEMTVKDQIPRKPPSGTTYIWLIDVDQDPSTGEYYENPSCVPLVGSDYNVRACYSDGQWQGAIDVIGGVLPGGGSDLEVSVEGNTISIVVQLGQIGYPTHFNWAIRTHVTPPYQNTRSTDYPDYYAICLISWVFDPVGDVMISPCGYIDMIQANVRMYLPNPVIESGMLIFEMTVKDQIPRKPPSGTTYIWLIDVDQDPSTGEHYPPTGNPFLGSDFNVRACFSDGQWQGWVDVTGGLPGGGSGLEVSVKGNTISIVVQLSQIGYPTQFNWAIRAHVTPDGTIAEDMPDTYAICLI